MRNLLLAVALVVSVAGLPGLWGGRHRDGFVQLRQQEEGELDSRLADSFTGIALIDQKIDHFNASDLRTFRQRYFYNNEYNLDKKSNVNFLYLSGEQTASTGMISGSTRPIAQYADKYDANLYALEHRYYGDSRPFLDTSTENLKFLSSRQAIEDIAYFIKTMNANSRSPDTQKWIAVGGSYAGALSAWARQLHPELIVGSIASSAPILAQFDFYGYMETVETNVREFNTCYGQLQLAIDYIGQLFETPAGRNVLDDKFPVSPKLATYADLQDNDINFFFQTVTEVFASASQYGTPKSVDLLCNEFCNHNGYYPVDALADLVIKYSVDPVTNTFDVNYTEAIVQMQDTSYSDDTDYTNRLWTWQTCTEFGYFQSTDRGDNIFQATMPINIYTDVCADLFDVDAKSIQKAIEETNAYYGQRDYYKGTNVMFTHGTSDPWSYLTKQLGTAQHWSVVVDEIRGGTHCADLNHACDSNGENCNDDILRVQQLTQENIDQWLNGPFIAPNSINITDAVGERPQFYNGYVPAPADIRSNDQGKNAPRSIRAKRSVFRNVRNGKKWKWNQFTGKSTRSLETDRPESSLDVEDAFFDQPWDHFNPNDERRFQQRFFVNPMYVNTDANGDTVKDAPNFLMIGGEGPQSGSWVKNEEHPFMKYAKEVGANVYLLEHRYYGSSTLKTTDLQFLTSAQMLYDVAGFISKVKSDRGQTGPWITFGGSYAGALAAWSREWFPELILGAVGSSGPVLAKNDFFEYLQVVEKVLRDNSQKCADRVQDAFDQLRKLSHDAPGRATISKKFNLNPAWSDHDNDVVKPINIQNVFATLYGVFNYIIQDSDNNNSQGRTYTVSQLCTIMEDEDQYPNSLDAVRYLQMWLYNDYDNPETGSDPEDDFAEMSDMWKYIDGHAANDPNKPYSDNDLASVLWTWQTCNEFGYYQTTDYGYGLFGNPVPLNFFITMCEQVFGVSMDHVEKGVARSNYQYGGRARFSATNVVLPNGDRDPWHALGIISQGKLDASVVPILIEGAAHCADMYSARDQDPPQLTVARATILDNIKKWLSGDSAPDTQTTTPAIVPTTSAFDPITTLGLDPETTEATTTTMLAETTKAPTTNSFPTQTTATVTVPTTTKTFPSSTSSATEPTTTSTRHLTLFVAVLTHTVAILAM